MSPLWFKDLKHSFASLYFVDAGLVLSDMQRLVIKASSYLMII